MSRSIALLRWRLHIRDYRREKKGQPGKKLDAELMRVVADLAAEIGETLPTHGMIRIEHRDMPGKADRRFPREWPCG